MESEKSTNAKQLNKLRNKLSDKLNDVTQIKEPDKQSTTVFDETQIKPRVVINKHYCGTSVSNWIDRKSVV